MPFVRNATVALTLGEIVPVDVEIHLSGTSYRAGQTLRLIVQCRAIEPDASLQRFVANTQGTCRVWWGGKYNSHLVIPVVQAVRS